MKRSPLKTSAMKPKVSDFQREFDAMKPKVHERSQNRCEARVADICAGAANHTHHRKYRSRGGSNALSNLLDVCGPCHDWIHANPDVSNEIRLSLHAGESEEFS